MYEVSFATLSERFFKQSSWPHVDQITDLVENDHVFGLLYKVNTAQRFYTKPMHDVAIGRRKIGGSLQCMCNSWKLDNRDYVKALDIFRVADVSRRAGDVLQALVCKCSAHTGPALRILWQLLCPTECHPTGQCQHAGKIRH